MRVESCRESCRESRRESCREKTVNCMRLSRNLVQDSNFPNHTISKFPGVEVRTELYFDEKPKKNGPRKDMDLRNIGKAGKTETIRKKAKYYKAG